MEDITVTLDDKEFSKIEKFKAEKSLDISCSICMGNLEKDEDVSKLPCEHCFHSSCVEKWLKEYNYTCPVCRKECGKGKYNV